MNTYTILSSTFNLYTFILFTPLSVMYQRDFVSLFTLFCVRPFLSLFILKYSIYTFKVLSFWQTYDICPGPVFRCEFDGGIRFVIRLTIFGNFSKYALYICFLHRFLIWFQPWWWLCNPESMLPHYMMWLSSGSVFQCDFSHDSGYVIRRLTTASYDMVIIWHRFLMWFQPW